MSQSEDFLSFEKALRELQLRSEELKKLVSEGEIRAYRDGDSMKFRADDIASLNSQSEGDTKLSFADSLEDDTGMVTEQISDEDTLAWKLQQRFPEARVSNFGTGGYGGYQSLLFMERELPRLGAGSVVLYVFTGHHTARNVAPRSWMRLLAQSLGRGQRAFYVSWRRDCPEVH